MKTTLSLHWKTLINKIHPPLPLTPRESQILLLRLNSSFRQRLDQRHPIEEGHSTHEHVQSILTSPLFLNDPFASGMSNRHALVQDVRMMHRNGRSAQNPTKAMKDAVSQGRATLETMTDLLIQQLAQSSAAESPPVSMKESRAGSTVLHWLWTSGMSRSLRFLRDHRFMEIVIQFLVAEGLHGSVRTWLDASKEKLAHAKAVDDPLEIRARIILELTRAETTYGKGLASAIESFVKLLTKWQLEGEKPVHIRNTFRPSANYILRKLRIALPLGEVDTSDYERVQRSAPLWCSEVGFERAWLAINHPGVPDAQPTVAYIRHLSAEQVRKMAGARKHGTVDISLKAAELCVSQNRRTEFAVLVEALRTYFPDDIGLEVDAAPSSLAAREEKPHELASVRLLDSLAVG